MYAETDVHLPAVGVGVLDDPWAAICENVRKLPAAPPAGVIPTFPVVPRKGRRGRRPLRWMRDGRCGNHMTQSEAAAQWRGGDGAPYRGER